MTVITIRTAGIALLAAFPVLFPLREIGLIPDNAAIEGAIGASLMAWAILALAPSNQTD